VSQTEARTPNTEYRTPKTEHRLRIEAVELADVRLRLKAPFITSFGATTERTCMIVTVHAGGLSGLGECVAFEGPWYSYETLRTARHVMVDFLIPRLVGADLSGPEEVWDLFASIRGHNMAKAAIEMACWDLFAKARRVALSSLVGGERASVPVGVSIGIQPSPEALVATAGRYLADGYGRLKLKIAPGTDISFVKAVRQAYPDAALQVDANSAYSLSDAGVFRAMDDFGLLLIEQPLGPDDIVDHRELQRQLQTPICLDESIDSPDDARHALDLGSCRIINIKAGRVGGHRQSRGIHDLCLERGARVWCGGMLETNIGRAHNVALASLPGFTLPGDISASERYYENDIAAPDFHIDASSSIRVPTGPGIGVELLPNVPWERRELFAAETVLPVG
jgi:O-succinylbenzoate synthase